MYNDKKPQRLIEQSRTLFVYGLFLIIGVSVFLSSPERSVSGVYETAATQWLRGESLYGESSSTGHGFLYFPHAAILHIPYAIISKLSNVGVAGDVVWRMVSWCLFAVACIRVGRWVEGCQSQIQWRVALVASLLGVSALRIGQSTLMMTALMILSIDFWNAKRFNWAAAMIILAIAVKPLAVVLGLLLFVVSPPLRKALAVGAIGLIAIPFALQNPNYVWNQYAECLNMLRSAASLGNNYEWAQLFGMLHVFGVSIPSGVQTWFRILAAAVTLGLVWRSTRSRHSGDAPLWLFTWTVVYLMLFNPRTENSTYCMMGPVYGAFVARAIVTKKRHLQGLGIFVLAILTAGSYEIGKHLTPDGYQPVWLAPLCCCVMLAMLLWEFWTCRDLSGEPKTDAHTNGSPEELAGQEFRNTSSV